MSVWSDVPFETCNPRAAFTAIAVDRNHARPTSRMIEGQDHSLFGRLYLLVIMNSGLGSSADFSETTFSTATKLGASYDDGAFFGGVMPDFVDRPRLCRTPCTNTSAKTNKTTIAGPVAATSYAMCALGTPNKTATWNSVSSNTAAPLIHAGAAKATSLPAHDDEG